MKKISTFVAAAAMTLSVAAPVFAEEANVNADPFVSTQGNAGLGLGISAGTAAAIVAGVIFVAAIASSSSDGSASTTTTN